MNLQQLIDRLTELRDRDPCVARDSPVIVEGYDDQGEHMQGSIESVSTEARCEDDDEAQAVYINLNAPADDVDDDREDPRVVGYP